jgi:Phage capsid family
MPMNPIKFEPPKPVEQPLRRQMAAPAGNTFLRYVAAHTKALRSKRAVAEVVERLWPNDMVLRAATAPALTTTVGWAKELAVVKVLEDLIEALGAASAGGEVLRRALMVNFDGAGEVLVPGLVVDVTDASFVAEGAPIPVETIPTSSKSLLPHKIASIAVLTAEMIEGSNAERIIGEALTRAAGLALDAALFDSTAASAARPAGIRNGIAALTASTNPDPTYAALEDISTLLNAVSVVGGRGPFVLITGVGRAMTAIARGGYTQDGLAILLPSAAVGNDLIAIAPAGIAAAISPPQLELSNHATVHLEDTSPADLGTSPAPVKSMFQTHSYALKSRLPATWVVRDSRAVAWLTPSWK